MAEKKKGAQAAKQPVGTCEMCAYFTYDEDLEYYVCEADLDEDDYVRFLQGRSSSCPFYRPGDEYLVVRHQM